LSDKTETRTCIIPWVPPSGSRLVRMHWSAQRKLVEVAGVYLARGLGTSLDRGLWRVRELQPTITIQMHRKRDLDKDNRYAACKPIFDALVRLGWAKDDSPKYMNQVVMPVIVDAKTKPYTEITIEWSESDQGEP